MPLAGFEPTIPVFKRAKTFHALDCAATVTGKACIYTRQKRWQKSRVFIHASSVIGTQELMVRVAKTTSHSITVSGTTSYTRPGLSR
jgi:hypothetical protein